MLTLRQHGPRMTPLKIVPLPYDKPLFPGAFKPKDLDEWVNLNLGNYLNRLDGSDAAITHLEKKLLDSDRPTVLFHFGDHQPSFDGSMPRNPQDHAKASRRSEFRHVLHDQEQLQAGAQYDFPALDLSFAGALILDIAGVKKDDVLRRPMRCSASAATASTLNCTGQALVDTYQDYIFQRLGALHE